MSPTTRYWLAHARFGLVIALGGVLALVQWQADNDRVALVAAAITVVAALAVYLLIDRPRAKGLRTSSASTLR